MERSTPATIHSQGWVSDWVDRAFGMDFEGGRLSFLNKHKVAIHLNILFSAAEALMVCLLGRTIKIAGGNVLCHIPGLAFLVEIKLVVVRLVIIDCPPRLVVGEELRWRGGERVCSTWLSSRCPSMACDHSDLMTNNAL